VDDDSKETTDEALDKINVKKNHLPDRALLACRFVHDDDVKSMVNLRCTYIITYEE
jgi:hypothetical protein